MVVSWWQKQFFIINFENIHLEFSQITHFQNNHLNRPFQGFVSGLPLGSKFWNHILSDNFANNGFSNRSLKLIIMPGFQSYFMERFTFMSFASEPKAMYQDACLVCTSQIERNQSEFEPDSPSHIQSCMLQNAEESYCMDNST